MKLFAVLLFAICSTQSAFAQQDEVSQAFKGCVNQAIQVNRTPGGPDRPGRTEAKLNLSKSQIDGRFDSVASITCTGEAAQRLLNAAASYANYSEQTFRDGALVRIWTLGPQMEGSLGSGCNYRPVSNYYWCNIHLGLFSGITKQLNF